MDIKYGLMEYSRFCKRNRQGINGACKQTCPLFASKNGSRRNCNSTLLERPEFVADAIEKWAKENPRKTYSDRFKELFVKARFDKGIPTVCCGDVFGFDCPYTTLTQECCNERWNKEWV